MVIAHDPVYPLKNIAGLSPCADGAGEIAAVGEGSEWKVGERVLVFTFDAEKAAAEEVPDLTGMDGKGAGDVQGTLREWGVFVSWILFLPSPSRFQGSRDVEIVLGTVLIGDEQKDADLVRAPEKLSFEEIASIGAAGGTAVNTLFFGPKPVKKGMSVLTQGTGGVSCFAIQVIPLTHPKVASRSEHLIAGSCGGSNCDLDLVFRRKADASKRPGSNSYHQLCDHARVGEGSPPSDGRKGG